MTQPAPYSGNAAASAHDATVADQFTRQAVQFAASPTHHNQAPLELLVGAAGPRPEDVSLDVACGPGSVVAAFARSVRRAEGLDATQAMLDEARKLAARSGLGNVAWHRGDVYALPFGEGAFDIVSCRYAFTICWREQFMLSMRAGISITVTLEDRLRLEAIVGDRNAKQKHVKRAKVILATADGCGANEIMRRSELSKPVVWRWQERFMGEGVDGLTRDKTRKPGKKPLPAATVQRVVDLALGPPPGEFTHWTGRMLAKAAGVSLRSVQRILDANQLAPHRISTFKLSNDPKFAEKLNDMVGLYVDPPAHAIVLSVDEKSQIQALDRTQPGLPLKKGRAGTMTHDYERHGTTTLFAALNTLNGTCHQQLHAASPAPGVAQVPRHHRRAGAQAQGDTCHRRQLRHAQASQGEPVARAASALDIPLHADERLMAQRRRRLLRKAHEAALPFRGNVSRYLRTHVGSLRSSLPAIR